MTTPRRFRIDFSVREVGVPEDQAQGVRFGDEADADGMKDFFDRCRDAAVTLFGTHQPAASKAAAAKPAPASKAPGTPKAPAAHSDAMLEEMFRIITGADMRKP